MTVRKPASPRKLKALKGDGSGEQLAPLPESAYPEGAEPLEKLEKADESLPGTYQGHDRR